MSKSVAPHEMFSHLESMKDALEMYNEELISEEAFLKSIACNAYMLTILLKGQL